MRTGINTTLSTSCWGDEERGVSMKEAMWTQIWVGAAIFEIEEDGFGLTGKWREMPKGRER